MSKRKRLTLENKKSIIANGMSFKYRSCKMKARFGRIEAEKAANQFRQRAYLCDFCGCWHLTKNVGNLEGK